MKEEKYINKQLEDYESPLDLNNGWSNLAKALNEDEDKPLIFCAGGLL